MFKKIKQYFKNDWEKTKRHYDDDITKSSRVVVNTFFGTLFLAALFRAVIPSIPEGLYIIRSNYRINEPAVKVIKTDVNKDGIEDLVTKNGYGVVKDIFYGIDLNENGSIVYLTKDKIKKYSENKLENKYPTK